MFDGVSFGLHADCSLAFQLAAFREAVVTTHWQRRGTTWRCEDGPMVAAVEAERADYAACVLGLRDYVNKNGFPGVVLGLSGGIDSALCAAMAVDALGAERVRCVMLPYKFTAQESLDDAAACAKALGVRYEILPIAPAVEGLEAALAPAFAGLPRDVTEENLQARARGTILMAISNKFGVMVVTTGNKSEMSVGYATLYGDMNGGFNPIKDLYKTEVFRLSRLRNSWKPDGALGPDGLVIPENIITRPPTAELRENQTDQDSLPPYEVLDPILERLVEREEPIASIVAAGFDRDIVVRVERMLNIAEYKRRQAAPGVKVTLKNFGRDRRYPITNRFRDPGTPLPAPDASLVTGKPAKSEAVDFASQRDRQKGRSDRAHGALGAVGFARRFRDRPAAERRRLRARIGADRLAVGADARLRQPLGILLGHDHVARRHRLVGPAGLERLGPAFARPAATAGRIERLAIAERGRQFGVEPAVERDRLRHFLAGIVIGVELRLPPPGTCAGRSPRRRGNDPAWSRTKSGNRSRRRCARRWCGRCRPFARTARRHAAAIAAEQAVEEAALLALQRGGPVLRTAAIVAERDQQRLPLRGAFGGAAAQLLELVLQALERVALLVDLPAQAAALRRRIVEDGKEPGTSAAHAARLRDQPVDLELLAVDRVLGAVDLVGALPGRCCRGRARPAALPAAGSSDWAIAPSAPAHDASAAAVTAASFKRRTFMTRHSIAKVMAVRASSSVRPCGLGAQIPQYAADDDQRAEQHENVEPLAVKRPADHRNQRNAHEVERNHQRGIAGAERVAETVVRRQAGNPDPNCGQNMTRLEMEKHRRVAAQAATAGTGSPPSRR